MVSFVFREHFGQNLPCFLNYIINILLNKSLKGGKETKMKMLNSCYKIIKVAVFCVMVYAILFLYADQRHYRIVAEEIATEAALTGSSARMDELVSKYAINIATDAVNVAVLD